MPYETHAIDLSGVEDEAAFDATVLSSLNQRAGELVADSGEALRTCHCDFA